MRDIWGMVLSVLCLVHCLAVPAVLIVMNGSIYLHQDHVDWTHYILIVPVVLLGLFAFPQNYRRTGSKPMLILGLLGCVSLAAGLIFHQFEVLLTIIGSIGMFIAHRHGYVTAKAQKQALDKVQIQTN